MDEKEIGYNKGQRHPSKIVNKKNNRWITRINRNPPSNGWLKVNILSTLLFSVITTFLAIMTFNSYTKIEGMQQMIGSFKPRVKLSPKNVRLTSDSIFINALLKNFGSRTALDISTVAYVITHTGARLYLPMYALPELEPNESITYEGKISRRPSDPRDIKKDKPNERLEDNELLGFGLVLKTIYTDAITGQKDSGYYYGINISSYYGITPINKADTFQFRAATQEEIKQIIEAINAFDSTKSF